MVVKTFPSISSSVALFMLDVCCLVFTQSAPANGWYFIGTKEILKSRFSRASEYLGPNIFDALRNTRDVLGAYRANFSDPSSVETRTSPTWTVSRENLRLR